jgi:hypothetical protein
MRTAGPGSRALPVPAAGRSAVPSRTAGPVSPAPPMMLAAGPARTARRASARASRGPPGLPVPARAGGPVARPRAAGAARVFLAQARAGGPALPVWVAGPGATAPRVSARTARPGPPRAQGQAQVAVASPLRPVRAAPGRTGPPPAGRHPAAVAGACGGRSMDSRRRRGRPTRYTRPASSRRGTTRLPGPPGSATLAPAPPARPRRSPAIPRWPSATRRRTRPRPRPGRSSTMISFRAAGHRPAPTVTGGRTRATPARCGSAPTAHRPPQAAHPAAAAH